MRSETELLTEFQSSRPQAALEDLFERYADKIYRLAIGLLGDADAAEDIVQETFLAALDHRLSFVGRSSLGTWLYRIAYNAAISSLRRRREEPLSEESDESDDGDALPMPKSLGDWALTPENLLVDAQTRARLDDAAQRLPQKLRAVFLLRDVEELSTEATAEVLGLTGSAVKVRLHRARLLLREALAPAFGSPEPRGV